MSASCCSISMKRAALATGKKMRISARFRAAQAEPCRGSMVRPGRPARLDLRSTGARGACSQGAFDFAEAISSERAFPLGSRQGRGASCRAGRRRQSRPFFDLNLAADEQSFFHFKFIRRVDGEFTGFEPDFANRLWSAEDGPEIWTHGDAAEIASAIPERKTLLVHFRQELSQNGSASLLARQLRLQRGCRGQSSTHRVGPPTRQPSTRAWVTVCSFAIPQRMRNGRVARPFAE